MSARVEGKPSLRGLRWVGLEPEDALHQRLSDLSPVERRVLAIRGIAQGVATFLEPSVVALPEADPAWARQWTEGPGLVAVPEWSAAGIVLACMTVQALRVGGRPEARLDPSGWPAPELEDGLALARGLVAEHPSKGALLRGFLKLAAVAAMRGDLSRPLDRACVAIGLTELDLGRHSPGLASAMNAAMTFPGGLVAADLARLADRIELGGALSLRLLEETDPPRARELGAQLARLRDGRAPPWSTLPAGRYELSLRSEELDFALQASLARLEPTGPGFPGVTLRVEGASIGRRRVIKELHLKASIDGRVDLLWRGGAEHFEHFDGRALVLYGHLGLSTWQGIQRLQLRVLDAEV